MKHTLAQAELKAVEIMLKGCDHGDHVKIATWARDQCPAEVGYRVAEVSWTRGSGGASIFQTYLSGLLFCAAVERYVITLMTFDDEDQHENGFIQDAALDLERLMTDHYEVRFAK